MATSQTTQFFLHQGINALAGAVATPSSTKAVPANEALRLVETIRADASTGTVEMQGSYDQDDDKIIHLRVAASAGTARRVSEPLFNGSGNGTMQSVAATGAAADGEYLATLVDPGIDSKQATLPLWHGFLRAVPFGTGGNTIAISDIDPTNSGPGATLGPITKGAPIVSVPEGGVAAGTDRLEGAKWDFGGIYLTAEGYIDPAVPRIQFGDNSTIRRQYRKNENGQPVFYFDTPVPVDITEGTLVFPITGAFTVTVTYGVTNVVIPDVITQFDLLKRLVPGANDFVEFVGFVANERTPGGMGVLDIDLRTDSYVDDIQYEIASEQGVDLETVSVGVSAATQRVTIECTDDLNLNDETWKVTAAVAGALGTATTGTAFASATASFTIPDGATEGVTDGAEARITSQAFKANDGTNTHWPRPEIRQYLIGPKATAKEFQFVYTLRGSEDCDPERVLFNESLSPACVGLSATQGGSGVAIDADYKTKLGVINSWLEAVLDTHDEVGAGNTYTGGSGLAAPITHKSDSGTADREGDVFIAHKVANLFIGVLRKITDATVLGSGERIAALAEWDTVFSTATSELTGIMSLDFDALSKPRNFFDLIGGSSLSALEFAGKYDLFVPQPGSENGYWYMLLSNGHSWKYSSHPDGGDPLPVWTTSPGVFTDGSGAVWLNLGLVDEEDVATQTLLISPDQENRLVERYEVKLRDALRLGDIDPFDSADSTGIDCWQDLETTHWWIVNGGEYLAMFTNSGSWYTVVKEIDENGNIIYRKTNELGLQIAIGCPETLQQGDTFTVSILGVNVDGRTYKKGDKILIDIVEGDGYQLAGGVSGDNTHTWAIRGPSGALADYSVINNAEVAYNQSGVSFTIFRGTQANQIQDQWRFYVSSRQAEISLNGGSSYAPAVDITDTPITVVGALQASFVRGPGIAWEPGDEFIFNATAPYSSDHALLPDDEGWQPAATGSLTVTMATDQTVDMVAIARHLLTAGQAPTVDVQDNTNTSLIGGVQVLAYNEDVLYFKLAVPVSARKVVFGNIDDASLIQWVWAGTAEALTMRANDCRPRRYNQRTSASGALNPRRLHQGKGWGFALNWQSQFSGDTGGWLWPTDIDKLRAIYDRVSLYDEPLVFIPNVEYNFGALASWASDNLEDSDVWRYQLSNRSGQELSVSVELGPIYQ